MQRNKLCDDLYDIVCYMNDNAKLFRKGVLENVSKQLRAIAIKCRKGEYDAKI